MELGNIPHTIRDSASKVTYVVMAYRTLSRDEVVATVRAYQAANRKPKPKSRVVIYSSLGAVQGL